MSSGSDEYLKVISFKIAKKTYKFTQKFDQLDLKMLNATLIRNSDKP